MPNHEHNGRDGARGGAPRPSWRVQDQPPGADRAFADGDALDDRDAYLRDDDDRDDLTGHRPDARAPDEGYRPVAHRGARYLARDDEEDAHDARSTEHHGQGQSGYTVGRLADDHALQGMQNRNQAHTGRQEDPEGGDRTDDRWAGRGGEGYWIERVAGDERGAPPAAGPRATEERGAHHPAHRRGASGFGYGPDPREAWPPRDPRDRQDARARPRDRGFGGAEFRGYNSGYNLAPRGGEPMGFGDQPGSSDASPARTRPGGQGGLTERDRGFGRQGPPQGHAGGGGFAGPARGGERDDERDDDRSGPWGAGHAGARPEPSGHAPAPHRLGEPAGPPPGAHRGKGPVGFVRSDERVRELVSEALMDDEHLDASAIEVSVADGEVTLAGRVPDRASKRRAEDVVEGCRGVRDVRNLLRVGALAPGTPPRAETDTPSPRAGDDAATRSESARKHRA